MESQEIPIQTMEIVHRRIKELISEHRADEENINQQIAGIFREMSEELGRREEGSREVLVKEYPDGYTITLSDEGVGYQQKGQKKILMSNKPDNYLSLVLALENDSDAKEKRARWFADGMLNLNIADNVLNLAYVVLLVQTGEEKINNGLG